MRTYSQHTELQLLSVDITVADAGRKWTLLLSLFDYILCTVLTPPHTKQKKILDGNSHLSANCITSFRPILISQNGIMFIFYLQHATIVFKSMFLSLY